MRNSLAGKLLYRIVRSQFDAMIKGQEDTLFGVMMGYIVDEISLRVMLLMGDALNRATAEALLLMANGHTLQGLMALIRSGLSRR